MRSMWLNPRAVVAGEGADGGGDGGEAVAAVGRQMLGDAELFEEIRSG